MITTLNLLSMEAESHAVCGQKLLCCVLCFAIPYEQTGAAAPIVLFL